MKKTWVVILLLAALPAAAQQVGHSHNRSVHHAPDTMQPPCHRYGLWYTPVWHSTIIDGLGVGVFAAPAEKNETLTVNGISIEADPLPPLFSVWATVEILVRSPEILRNKHKERTDSATKAIKHKSDSMYQGTTLWDRRQDTLVKARINGISISTGITESKTTVTGLAINAIWGLQDQMRGVEVTSLVNLHYSFTGLMVAAGNSTTTGRGVQIGIYNRCREGRLIQVGLLNKIGKRTLPFINFSFRHRKPAS